MKTSALLGSKTTRGALVLFLGVLSCGERADSVSDAGSIAPPAPPQVGGPDESLTRALSPLVAPCTLAMGVLTVTVNSGETAILSRRTSDDALLVNGDLCTGAATATATNVSKVAIVEGVT